MARISREQFEKRLAQLCLHSGGAGLPARASDRTVLLKSMALLLERSRTYSEVEVDAVLKRWCVEVGLRIDTDHVNLRRLLVDEGYLERERDGSAYRVSTQSPDRFDTAVDRVDPVAAITSVLARREKRKRRFTASH